MSVPDFAAHVGDAFTVTLQNGSTFTADVFSVESGFVGFRKEMTHTFATADYHVVAIKSIKTAERLGVGRPAIPYCMPDRGEIAMREDKSLVVARKRDKAITSGVPPHALPIFEGVARTFQLEWDSDLQGIIVMDRAVIRAPYDWSAVYGKEGVPEDAGLMTRLREKVLPRIWQELGSPQGAPEGAASRPAPSTTGGAGMRDESRARSGPRGPSGGFNGGNNGGDGGGKWSVAASRR